MNQINLFELFASVSLDTSEYERGVKEVSDSGSSLGGKLKSGLATAGSIAAKGIGLIAGAAVAAGGALLALESSTEEYRIAQGKLNTAFEAAGYSTDTAKQAYTEFYKILGDTDTATEASQLLAKLAQSEEDVATWTNIAAGVSGTFGDSLPIEGLIEAANETAKVGTVTGVLADALNWAGISEDEFNAKLASCTTESERNQLIMDTLSGTYDEASDAFYRNNDALVESRERQSEMQDSMAKVGDAVAKVKNAFLKQFGPAIEKAAEKLAEWISKIDVDEIFDRINRIVDNFKFGWEMISEIWSAAIEFFKTIGNGIIDAFVFVGDFISSIFQAANDAITWVFESLPSFFSGIWEGIKSVFSTVVEFFSTTFSNAWTMIQTVWSIVVGFFSGIWQGIQTVFSTVISFFSGIFSSAWATISSIWSVVVGFFSGIWNGITSVFSGVASFFSTAFSNAITGIKSVWGTITSFFSEKWESIKDVFKDALSNFKDIGSDIVEGIKNGISNGWNALKNWVKEKAQSLLDAAKDALGISSPSKEFRDKVGIWIPAGIEEGLEKGMPSLLRTINDSIGPDNLIGDYNFSYGMTRTTRKGSGDQSLSYAINMLSDKLDNLKIYLDTGKMVGEMSSEIDKRLGKNLSINRKATIV